MESMGCAFQPRGASLSDMADGKLAELLKKLRADRGWSQAHVAEQAQIAQTVLSRLERGAFRNPSSRVLAGLANAYSIPISQLVFAGMEDQGEPAERPAAPRANFRFKTAVPPDAGSADPRAPEEDETPLESALFAVMDSKKYRAPVFDAARRVIRETYRFTREDADLEAQARTYLDAAARLHREGKPLSTPAILAYVINGSLPGAAEVAKERAANLTEKADAELRAKGMEPGQGADRLAAAIAKRGAKG